MRRVVKILENWIHTQVFQRKQYYTIPEGITAFPIDVKVSKDKVTRGKEKTPELIFVQIIVILAGRKILKYIKPTR